MLLDRRDRQALLLIAVHLAVVASMPPFPVIALGIWWNANTVSHQFTHRRFFRSRTADDRLSLVLGMLLGVPQRLWRQMHLAHHAGRPWRPRRESGLLRESLAIAVCWGALAACSPSYFVAGWLPGFATAQVLCWLQGHYEHASGTTSTYAGWWNLLFLNDGYHAEHHAAPTRHFRDLPRCRIDGARSSIWPPVLRWLDAFSLDGLERLALRSAMLRSFLLRTHRRAIERVLQDPQTIRSVIIVGGGLFPRTAIVLRELLPHAQLTVIDADAAHLQTARAYLPRGVAVVHGTFTPARALDADLVVLPLALRGSRRACYAAPPAPLTLVHDWIWRPAGASAVVSPWLLKRVNLVTRARASRRAVG